MEVWRTRLYEQLDGDANKSPDAMIIAEPGPSHIQELMHRGDPVRCLRDTLTDALASVEHSGLSVPAAFLDCYRQATALLLKWLGETADD